MLEISTNFQNDRVYFEGKKDQVADENIFRQTNKQSIKVMLSVCLAWNAATKPSCVNGCGVIGNTQAYK